MISSNKPHHKLQGVLANSMATALLLAAGSVQAAPGDPDPSFGNNGLVVADIANSPDIGRAVALQPDGRILVAGRSNLTFSLARFETDGSLDTSFGSNGRVVTSINNGDTAYALAVQPDGRILVAGTSVTNRNEFALVRYLPDGSLDTSFDGDGMLTTPIGLGSGAAANAIALQADGKIVRAGQSTESNLGVDLDFALVRYNPNGSLDTSFGGDGKVTTAIGAVGANDIIEAAAIQPDGKIVVVGSTVTQDFVVARYNPDGSLDPGFDSDGIVLTEVSGPDFAYAVVLQPDGKIVVSGQAFAPPLGPLGYALVRYNSDGSLDTSFSNDGIVVTHLPGLDQPEARALAVLPDGRILAGGSGLNATTDHDFSLVRYNADGRLDSGFGNDGIATFTIAGSDDRGYGLAVQPDGHVLLAGWRQATNDFVLLRVEGSPLDVTPDPFRFDDETDVAPIELRTSNLISISGLGAGVRVPVGVTGGEYALNVATVYTSAITWVGNGDQINVRHTSAAADGATTDTTIFVGGVMAPNSITPLGDGEVIRDTFRSTTASAASGGGGGSGLGMELLLLMGVALLGRICHQQA